MTDTSGPQAPPRRLTRSASDRMVAGVCGGLARYTGIDPVIFRVALAVATVLGGFGLVAYAVAWIVIPEDDAAESHAETMLRRQSLPRPVAIGIGVVVAVLALAVFDSGPFDGHDWGGGGIGLLVLIGIGVWLYNRDRDPSGPVVPPVVPPVPMPPVPPQPLDATATMVSPVVPPVPPLPPIPPVPPQPPRPAAPASKLGALTISAMLLVAGFLALLEVSGAAEVPLDVALALLLMVLGAGLLLGAWVGRARWLIALGLPLTAAAALATALDVPFAGGMGERTWRPDTVADVESTYRLGVGEAVLDLSQVDLAGRDLEVEVSLAVGELTVLLPEGGDVEVDARTGLGELEAPGFADDGADVRHVTVYEASGAGSLDLELRLGLGRLEVVR